MGKGQKSKAQQAELNRLQIAPESEPQAAFLFQANAQANVSSGRGTGRQASSSARPAAGSLSPSAGDPGVSGAAGLSNQTAWPLPGEPAAGQQPKKPPPASAGSARGRSSPMQVP